MLFNNAVYMISCQSVLPSLALSSLLIFTIIFNLKLEHTGFQKALQYSMNIFSSVQSLSHVQFFASPWTAACQASLSITNSQSFAQTHVHQVGDAIQLSHPRSSPSPSAFNLSQDQGLF